MSDRCPTCRRKLLPSETAAPKMPASAVREAAAELDAARDGDRKQIAVRYSDRFGLTVNHVYRLTRALRRSFSNRGRHERT